MGILERQRCGVFFPFLGGMKKLCPNGRGFFGGFPQLVLFLVRVYLRSTPPPGFQSQIQDYYETFLGSGIPTTKPSFATIASWGVDPRFTGLRTELCSKKWMTYAGLTCFETCGPRKKPWLVGLYKGLYYPVI